MAERLIVGLGNPGKDYEYTRHNLGFLVLEHISQSNGLKWKRSVLCDGVEAEGKDGDLKFRLLMPSSFMNNSGKPVKQFVRQNDFDLKNVLVVCDDFNLNFGQLRVRRRGSDGGHNGLHSIIYHLESEDFCRLRLGIGMPPGKKSAEDYVLEEFTKKEREELGFFVDEASHCCLLWLTKDLNEVMSQFNKRKENEQV